MSLRERSSLAFYSHRTRSRRILVGSGLLDVKLGLEPQARAQIKILKVFLRRFHLSIFLAKTLRVNKIVMKSFSNNLSFAVDFKLKVPPVMYKISIHNISDVRNKVNNPD